MNLRLSAVVQAWLCVSPAVMGLSACDSHSTLSDERTHASVGVFYGGQIQEKDALAVSPARPPTLGFRIDFAQPYDAPHQLEYEIVRPGPGGRRVMEVQKLEIPAGRTHFDQRIEVGPVIFYGTWNVRALCDGIAVLDRAIVLTREP